MKTALFLDIDGVLNSEQYAKTLNRTMIINGNGEFPDIDSTAMEKLNTIINQTDCDIILSSGWRFFPKIKEFLQEKGLCKSVTDVTIGECYSRAEEVALYLQNHKYDKFVIVDDNDFDFTRRFPFNFVQTSFQDGLTDDKVEIIIKKLK